MLVTQSARSALFFSLWNVYLVNISSALSNYYSSSTINSTMANSSDYYGYAVAASDYYGTGTNLITTILVVGAPQFDYYVGSPSSTKSGYAQVNLCPTATSCVFQDFLGEKGGNAEDSFGATVATANGFIVVGIPHYEDPDTGNINGAVLHYHCSPPNCTTLGSGGGVEYTQLGSSVGVSYLGLNSWFIVAGASYYAGSYGGFYSYTCTSSSCSPNVGGLPFVEGPSGSNLGYAIAVWQTLIVVSAPEYTFSKEGSSYIGQVFVYSVPTATPTATPSLLYTLSNPDSPNNNDYFGQSVAVSLDSSNGGLIVVGAPNTNSNRGAIYVYKCTYSSPTYTCSTTGLKITASDVATGDNFGSAVDVTGYTVVVTSRGNQKVYLFDCSPSGTSCLQISTELPTSTFSSITFSSRFGYTGAVTINESATLVSVGDPLATVNSNSYEGIDITFGCQNSSSKFPYCSSPMPTPTTTATATATSTATATATSIATSTPTSTATSISTPNPSPSTAITTNASQMVYTSTPTPAPQFSSTSPTESTPTPSPFAIASSSNAGAIAGGIIGALIGVVLVVLLLWFVRLRYWSKRDVTDSSDYKNPMITMSDSKSQRHVSQASAGQADDILIPFNSLKLGAVLGQGNFGQVYQATYRGGPAAVKKLKGVDKQQIMEEAKMMKSVPPHSNVLQYFGVSEHEGEIMMVTELCDKGNLAQYLRNSNNKLTLMQYRQLCGQIASGMWHISTYGIVHRDLRAENVLVQLRGTEIQAKVADFGLARSLNRHDQNDPGYYRMTEAKEIPIAWTAPEVLTDQLKYVAASDVWSFGIVMWEIYSKGAKPFDGMSVQLMAASIRDPNRTTPLLARPTDCPDDIFAIMNSCWAFNPQDRPTFEQLYNQLS